jgi:hypothetical protein
MKLLVALSIVGYCLAMPTPTNNATDTLFRMMEKMKDRLFSAQCVTENPTNDPKMTVWTQPMECMWPRMHNMSQSVDEWATMMGNTGCTVPQESMMKMLKRVMQQRHYENSPIIRKFPTAQCGMCGRRIQCCPATQFLVQSYRSTACESAPCQVEPMTVENWNYVREKYPEWNIPTTNEPCNFASIMRESMVQSKVFPFMKTMYMQMVGSEMPTMNCQMVENMCACCCGGFVYQGGKCVPEVVMTTTNTMTTQTMMVETTPMMVETTMTMTTMMPVVETTIMPVVETTMEVMTTTVRPIPVHTTPKTLFNADEETEAEEEEEHEEEDKRKRRSLENNEDSDESSEELEEKKEVEVLAEKVAEEIVAHEGEGGAEDLVAEVVAEEIVVKEDCTTTEVPMTPEVVVTEAVTIPPTAATIKLTEATIIKLTEATIMTEAVTEKPTEAWTTMKPTEEWTTMKPTDAWTTMKPTEAWTTMKPSEVWTEGTTMKPTIPVEIWTAGTTILPINGTTAKAIILESTAAPLPTPIPTKIETPVVPKEIEKPILPKE